MKEGITQLTNVPTALERSGDFSQSFRPPIDLFTQQPFPEIVYPRKDYIPLARRSSTSTLCLTAMCPGRTSSRRPSVAISLITSMPGSTINSARNRSWQFATVVRTGICSTRSRGLVLPAYRASELKFPGGLRT